MPLVPAFCDTCGAIFSSGIAVENSTNVSFSNCTAGPCPKCGGTGHVPDGVFNFIGTTIEVLSAPTRTVDDLQRFIQIIQKARTEKHSKTEITEQLKKDVPKLARVAELLPTNRSELYGFLALILATAPLFQSQNAGKTTINNVITAIYGQAPPPVAPLPKQPEKTGRNDPCPCGSGKKYKKCHGAPKQ